MAFDVILAICAINMSGFEYVFQPFKQELSKKTENKVHLEIVKTGRTGASIRKLEKKKTVSYWKLYKDEDSPVMLRDLE